MGKRPIDVWRVKLEFLQSQEPAVSDPAQKFTLREQIEEARQKIAELEAANTAYDIRARDPQASQQSDESLAQITERVLGAYHRTVQEAWGERWSGSVTDNAADE